MKFRINSIIRFFIYLFFLITIADLFLIFFLSREYLSVNRVIFSTFWCLIALYFSLDISKLQYHILDNMIIVKRFIRKSQFYPVSDILSIKSNSIIYPMYYIEIEFINNKKMIVLPIKDSKLFIETLLAKS